MGTLIYVTLLGAFSYHCHYLGSKFKGSSRVMKEALASSAGFGFLAFFVFIIIGFFHFTWWQPLLALIAPAFLSIIVSRVLDNILGMFLSIIAVIVLIVICIIQFI